MIREPHNVLQGPIDDVTRGVGGSASVAKFVSRDTKLHKGIAENKHLNKLVEELREATRADENPQPSDDEVNSYLASTLNSFENQLKNSQKRYEGANEKQFFKNLEWGTALLKGLVALKLQNDAFVVGSEKDSYNVPLDQEMVKTLHDANTYARHFARAAADVMESDGVKIQKIFNDVIPLSFVEFIEENLGSNGQVKKNSVLDGICSEVNAAVNRAQDKGASR